MPIDHRQLQAFAAVARLGSFERAAQQLHVTASAVSQRLKLLEERLGQLLIVRGQPLQLTPAGEKLLAHQQQLQLLEQELLEGLRCDRDSGPIRLTVGVNADSLATWFLDALSPLLAQSGVLLDLRVCDQDQTLELLRRGEVLGCVSAHPRPIQGCHAVPLGAMRYRALASPDFFQRHFRAGVTAAQLRQAPAVEFDPDDALQRRYLSSHFGLSGGDYPCHRVPSPEAFLAMIRNGWGWGMVPDLQLGPGEPDGVLRELTPGRHETVTLYWHSLGLASSTLKQTGEYLQRYCREHLTLGA